MVWLPDGEKNFEDVFIRFDMIHERDRQTDRRTDRHRITAIAALMHSIARQKPNRHRYARLVLAVAKLLVRFGLMG